MHELMYDNSIKVVAFGKNAGKDMIMRKLLSMLCVLALLLSLAACGAGEELSETEPGSEVAAIYDAYTPYDETVTLTTGTTVLGAGGLPSGDDYENNVFTRFLQKTQNIKMDVAWSVDSSTYASKVALCIAGKDLPDVLVVNRSTFKQMADNDLLADLTEVYDSCISDFLRAQLDSYGEGLMKEVTVDGKLLGIPSPSLNNCQNVLWIRSDWLEKAGLEAPKTLEDIEKTARKFIELKLGGENTIGITTTSKLYGGYNSSWGLDSVFSAFGAYPGSWLEIDGKAVYGSVQPEMKDALELLRSWYAAGILDKEFAVRDEASRQSLIGSGRCGMYFGVWWPSNGVADIVELDKEADWIAVSAPLDANGKLKTAAQDPIQKIAVVSKKCKHPEAVIKALNAGYDVLRCNREYGNPYVSQTEEAYKYFFETSPQGWGVMPVPIEINWSDCVGRIAREMKEAVEKEDPSILSITGFESSYEYILYNSKHPKENRVYYHEYLARVVGAGAATEDCVEVVPTCFYGTTKTMSTLWSSLEKLESEIMLKIVMGEEPVSAFDDFIGKWYSSGGEQITQEVEEARNG